jgi:hypothetical protein
MKTKNLLAALALSLVLAASAWAAPAKKQSSHSGTMKMSGTILDSSSNELTLQAKVKGKNEQEIFVINPETKTTGTLTNGERATVSYKNENGKKVATMVSTSKMESSKKK